MRSKDEIPKAKAEPTGLEVLNRVRLEAMIKELQRQVQNFSNDLANAKADVAQRDLFIQAKNQEIAELQKQIAASVVKEAGAAKRKR